jgi:hypothetical protein
MFANKRACHVAPVLTGGHKVCPQKISHDRSSLAGLEAAGTDMVGSPLHHPGTDMVAHLVEDMQ